MTDERDDLDRALAAGLGNLADEPDADAVLAGMRPRFQRARRRHRVAQASIAVVVLAAIAGAGALLARPAEKRGGGVQIAPTTIAPERDGTHPPGPARTTTTVTGATRSTVAPGPTTTTPTTPAAGPSNNRGPGPNAGPGGSGSNDGSNSGPVSRPAASLAPSTTTAAGQLHTYTAPGGTLTIRFANGALALVSHHPNAGYSEEIHDNQADRIELRFSGPTDSRIRVRVENGQLVEEQQ